MFFLSRKMDPVSVLGEDKAGPSLRKLREMEVPESAHGLLARCGADVEVGLPAYHFFRGKKWDGSAATACLALAIIQMYRNQRVNWVYIDDKKYRLPRERAIIMRTIRQIFCVDGDMLGSVVNVFTAIACAEKPVEFCRRNSFNFRCYRETRRVFYRLASAVWPSLTTASIAREITRDLWTAHGETIPRFLWRWFPRLDTRREANDRPYYPDQRFCSLSRASRHADVSVLELVRKDEDSVALWTRYPLKDYRENPWVLAAVMEGHRERMDHRLAWRSVFGIVVGEIRDEVAFRPGMCGMEAAMTDFFSHREGR
jgi:hypothetical protein